MRRHPASCILGEGPTEFVERIHRLLAPVEGDAARSAPSARRWRNDPLFAALTHDPRYRAILKQVNLPDTP